MRRDGESFTHVDDACWQFHSGKDTSIGVRPLHPPRARRTPDHHARRVAFFGLEAQRPGLHDLAVIEDLDAMRLVERETLNDELRYAAEVERSIGVDLDRHARDPVRVVGLGKVRPDADGAVARGWTVRGLSRRGRQIECRERECSGG